ncbi:MAG: alpha-2-macroglobulin family protein [Vulcanimicrobiaceae bacterium]
MARRTCWLLALGFALAASGCAAPIRGPVPLATVSPLPAPPLPPWIASVSPVTRGASLTQIRVIFAQPVLPVEALETNAEREVLAHFSIAPALAGRFRVLTPRMIGFEPESAYPAATRVRIALTAGLRDLRGDRLDHDLAWTFETQPLRFALADQESVGADPASPGPLPVTGLQPTIRVRANAPVDVDSLAQHTSFRSGAQRTAATVSLEPPPSASPPEPRAAFDASRASWVYTISPREPLRKATQYRLAIDAGVSPRDGNVPSSSAFERRFVTFAPLRVVAAHVTTDPNLSDTASRFAGGDPAVLFNGALDRKTLDANVALAPEPVGSGKLLTLSDDGTRLYVNPYRLLPLQTYTLTFKTGLRGTYGQSLAAPSSVRITTARLAPYLWAPSGTNTFVSTSGLRLQYTAVNLPQNRYRASYRRVDPAQLVYIDTAAPQDTYSLLPPLLSWRPFPVAGAHVNSQTTVDVPVRDLMGGARGGVLAYGVTAGIPQQRSSLPYYGLVQLTNLGISTQWFPEGGSVAVQRLSDGAPVQNARVDVYVSHLYERPDGTPEPCASGTTKTDGMLAISGIAIERCFAGNRPPDEAPSLLIVARAGNDWSYVRSLAYSMLGTYDGDMTWTEGQPLSRGTIFSDRALYQPGERAWLTAVCYALQNGVLHADRHTRYKLRLLDPNGNARSLPAQTTNGFATLSFPLDLAKSQALGYYTIVATSPDGTQTYGTFRVAEFKPPNFSVTLALDRTYAVAGSSVRANGSARYLYGTPMNGAGATVHVTREPVSFTPPGWEQFQFGRQWFWPEEAPDVSSDVLAQPVTLDAQGRAGAGVRVDDELPLPMTYRVDFEVTDASRLSSSDTQTFTALPSATLIGLQSDFVGTMGRPARVAAVVTDPAGKTISGQRIHLELQKMDFGSITQIVEGSEAARNHVTYTTVARADVTSGPQAVNVTFTPPEPGPYRIRANVAGSVSDAGATDAQLWVSGPGIATWAQPNRSDLPLKLDKASYRAGEAATLAVASPYARADLYLEVVRDRILSRRVIAIDGTAPRIRIPIDRTYFPNAAIYAVLVRRGPPLDRSHLHEVDSLARIGMARLTLDLRPQYLSVAVRPGRKMLEPGMRQHVQLTAHDASGKPVRAQFTVIVANESVLQLSGYRPPDLVKTVFAEQPISMRDADNRPQITLEQPGPAAQKGWGYGGGFLAGAAGTRVRTRFLPLAYFAGAVHTDAAGKAAVDFTLPDDLTTWRVMAVAIDAQPVPHFGTADATFVTSKPLVTNPMLPQFARTGDRIDAGLSLLNAGNTAQAKMEGVLTGALQFASPQPAQRLVATQTVQPGLNAVRFPMLVGEGSATMEFRTTLGDRSDAFRAPLEVRNADVSETRIDAGATDGSARIPLDSTPGRGTIRIAVAGSLVPVLTASAAHALDRQSFDAFLAPLASRLGVASSLAALEHRGAKVKAHNPSVEASRAAAAIAGLQRMDGGFGFWPNAGYSDAFGTAYAASALAYARRNGIAIQQRVLTRAKPYLVHALADPHGADRSCIDAPCKSRLRLVTLTALADLGDRRTDFLQDLYAQRDRFSIAQRAVLARYLQRTPGWQSEAAALAREIEQSVYLTGRYATVQDATTWLYSPVEAQAAYLQMLLAGNAPADRIDRAERALLAQSCRCGWPSPQDADAALRALVEASQRESARGNFSVTVLAGSRTLGRAQIATTAEEPSAIVADLREFPPNAHEIVLHKDGAGTLHYVVEYTYRVPANAPGRIEGLRVTRAVRSMNQKAVLASIGLAPQSGDPLAFPAGNVFDVALTVVTDHPVDRVVLSDPLPAGFEALDTSFATTASYYEPLASSWQIDYQQIYRDRVMAFANRLPAGVYEFHYLVRSVTPGAYSWPGAQAQLLFAPEEFGRSASALVTVSQ